MTILLLHFGETLKTRFLKSCRHNCSAIKNYTTVRFSGDKILKHRFNHIEDNKT